MQRENEKFMAHVRDAVTSAVLPPWPHLAQVFLLHASLWSQIHNGFLDVSILAFFPFMSSSIYFSQSFFILFFVVFFIFFGHDKLRKIHDNPPKYRSCCEVISFCQLSSEVGFIFVNRTQGLVCGFS
jgi:hypothetical protein